jgi:hypothetical protein
MRRCDLFMPPHVHDVVDYYQSVMGLFDRAKTANERHVCWFARPDGSTYETSWRGLGTGTTAQASASLRGHRVIGEVITGPAVEGTPARDAGGVHDAYVGAKLIEELTV